MSFFENVVSGVKNTVGAVGRAVSDGAEGIGGAVADTADAAGEAVQTGLGLVSRWADDTLGDSPGGRIVGGAVDVARVLVAAAEFVVEVLGTAIVLAGAVAGDVLQGRLGSIPGRVGAFLTTVLDAWDEAVDQVSRFGIGESVIGRSIAGARRIRAKAWSVAAGLRPNVAGTPDPRTYTDTGKRYEFELRDGAVWFRETGLTCVEPQFQRLVLEPGDTTGSMIGFDRRRSGDREASIGDGGDVTVRGPILPVPLFDSIVASMDRVFAKEEGKDNFYFLLMDELFWGPRTLSPDVSLDTTAFLPMPSNYFKLDPEKNLAGASQADLLRALDGPLPVMPQSERHPLFRKALEFGVVDMIVKVRPRLWYRLDCRPPLGAGPVPAGLPTYDHVTYRAQNAFVGWAIDERREASIDFAEVLDIGVGNTHFHELWTNVHGGEMRNTRLEHFQGIAIGTISYSMLNGPISDGDHFADGTCNFYILVRLCGSERIVVLYCDEQTLFTQRWRLVDPSDKEWVSFERFNFSLAAALDPSREGAAHGFRPEEFWSPFGSSYLDRRSRMTVSRGVVVVSGSDPESGEHELYSVNFGYGISDRTWRWRGFGHAGLRGRYVPEEQLVGVADDVILKETEPGIVFPQTLHLREDMMLTVAGTDRATDGSTIPGYWCQPYLPVDCELVPRREEHSTAVAERGPGKPMRGFRHPWTFYSAGVFRVADRFSHLGVYQRVDFHVQFYEVDLVAGDAPIPDNIVWVFRDEVPAPPMSVSVAGVTIPVPPVRPGPEAGRLYIKARKLDWRALAEQDPRLLRSLPRDLEALGRELARRWEQVLYKWEEVPASVAEADRRCRASRRSMYNRDGLFVLRNAGPLGWIALWSDKRDGDLLALSDLPMEVDLFAERDPRRRIRVRFKRNCRVYQPPVVLEARVRLIRSATGDVLQIGYRTDRSRHEQDVNLWRWTLAALDCEVQGEPVRLLAAGVHSELARPVAGRTGDFEIELPRTRAWADENAGYFGVDGRLNFGTSLWFENVVGQVACPASTSFELWDMRSGVDEGVVSTASVGAA